MELRKYKNYLSRDARIILHMKKLSHLLIGILLPALGVSCTTPLTKEEKQSMKSVHVPVALVEPSTYGNPTMISNDAAGTIGFASGFAGGLIGGAIATAVVAGLEANHMSKNKENFAVIRSNTPELGPLISAKLHEKLKSDPFFGTRLTQAADAPAKVRVEVTGYGLEKTGSNHSPAVSANISLCLAEKELRTFSKVTDGYNGRTPYAENKRPVHCASLEQYQTQPEMLRQHYEVVVGYLVEEIAEALNEMLGEDGKNAPTALVTGN